MMLFKLNQTPMAKLLVCDSDPGAAKISGLSIVLALMVVAEFYVNFVAVARLFDSGGDDFLKPALVALFLTVAILALGIMGGASARQLHDARPGDRRGSCLAVAIGAATLQMALILAITFIRYIVGAGGEPDALAAAAGVVASGPSDAVLGEVVLLAAVLVAGSAISFVHSFLTSGHERLQAALELGLAQMRCESIDGFAEAARKVMDATEGAMLARARDFEVRTAMALVDDPAAATRIQEAVDMAKDAARQLAGK